MSFDQLQGRKGFGARLFMLRFRRLKLSQQAFADRFGLTKGQIKDLEQSRAQPPRAMVLLVAAIEIMPYRMAEIARKEGLTGAGEHVSRAHARAYVSRKGGPPAPGSSQPTAGKALS